MKSIAERLTLLVVVILPVKDLSVARVAVRVLSDDVRPRVLLVLQRAGQSEAESDRSTAERTRHGTCEIVSAGYHGDTQSLVDAT